MKRYLLFTGYNYYPSGGWDDFHSDHDTLESAKEFGEHALDNGCGVDWAHIVDTQNLNVMPTKWMTVGKYWS